MTELSYLVTVLPMVMCVVIVGLFVHGDDVGCGGVRWRMSVLCVYQ